MAYIIRQFPTQLGGGIDDFRQFSRLDSTFLSNLVTFLLRREDFVEVSPYIQLYMSNFSPNHRILTPLYNVRR